MWKQFKTLNSESRAFNVGIFGSNTESKNSPWHRIADPLQSEFDELGADSSLAYYASWPLQMYIKGFDMSCSLGVTYTYDDNTLDRAPSNPHTVGCVPPNTHNFQGTVTLKVNGGTYRATQWKRNGDVLSVSSSREGWMTESDD